VKGKRRGCEHVVTIDKMAKKDLPQNSAKMRKKITGRFSGGLGVE